VRKFLGQ